MNRFERDGEEIFEFKIIKKDSKVGTIRKRNGKSVLSKLPMQTKNLVWM